MIVLFIAFTFIIEICSSQDQAQYETPQLVTQTLTPSQAVSYNYQTPQYMTPATAFIQMLVDLLNYKIWWLSQMTGVILNGSLSVPGSIMNPPYQHSFAAPPYDNSPEISNLPVPGLLPNTNLYTGVSAGSTVFQGVGNSQTPFQPPPQQPSPVPISLPQTPLNPYFPVNVPPTSPNFQSVGIPSPSPSAPVSIIPPPVPPNFGSQNTATTAGAATPSPQIPQPPQPILNLPFMGAPANPQILPSISTGSNSPSVQPVIVPAPPSSQPTAPISSSGTVSPINPLATVIAAPGGFAPLPLASSTNPTTGLNPESTINPLPPAATTPDASSTPSGNQTVGTSPSYTPEPVPIAETTTNPLTPPIGTTGVPPPNPINQPVIPSPIPIQSNAPLSGSITGAIANPLNPAAALPEATPLTPGNGAIGSPPPTSTSSSPVIAPSPEVTTKPPVTANTTEAASSAPPNEQPVATSPTSPPAPPPGSSANPLTTGTSTIGDLPGSLENQTSFTTPLQSNATEPPSNTAASSNPLSATVTPGQSPVSVESGTLASSSSASSSTAPSLVTGTSSNPLTPPTPPQSGTSEPGSNTGVNVSPLVPVGSQGSPGTTETQPVQSPTSPQSDDSLILTVPGFSTTPESNPGILTGTPVLQAIGFPTTPSQPPGPILVPGPFQTNQQSTPFDQASPTPISVPSAFRPNAPQPAPLTTPLSSLIPPPQTGLDAY